MPPYTPDDLYAVLLANVGTLEDKAAADSLAASLRLASTASTTPSGLKLLKAAVVDPATTKIPVYLTTVLTSPFSTVVPVLLLLSGLVLCFAGTFFTLDRTRQVPARKKESQKTVAYGEWNVPESEREERWKWESTGGVGGAVAGWVAGGQLTTSLTLWIVNRTDMDVLSGTAFFAVWLLASVIFAVVGARWRFAVFAMMALLGSHSLTLLLTQSFRLPTTLARLVPFAVFLVPLLVLPYLPYPALQHHSLRVSTAFAGSYTVALALSLLTKLHDWANGETLVFVAGDAGLDWKSASWKTFCAVGWLVGVAGFGVDALLKAKLGENPDETWSSYLSAYESRGLPSSTPRQGTFTPHLSPWSRLLSLNKPHAHHPHSPILDEKDADILPTNTSLGDLRERDRSVVEQPLKLARFRPGEDDSDSDDDEKGDLGKYAMLGMEDTSRVTPWLPPSKAVKFSSSAPSQKPRPSFTSQDSHRTLVDSDPTSYTRALQPRGPRRRESLGGKVETLIKRYDSISSLSSVQRSPSDRKTSLHSLDNASSPSNPSNWTPASRFSTSPPLVTPIAADNIASPLQPAFPPRSLPETPSLLQAYDRIARGQQEARVERMNSFQAKRAEGREREEQEERETKGEWEMFWEEVRMKSGAGEREGEKEGQEGPNGGSPASTTELPPANAHHSASLVTPMLRSSPAARRVLSPSTTIARMMSSTPPASPSPPSSLVPISPLVSLAPGNPSLVKSGSPSMIVLCGWMGAKPAHLQKYVDLHKSIFANVPVLVLRTEPRAFLQSADKRRDEVKEAVELVPRVEGGSGGLFFHAFSNGGSLRLIDLLSSLPPSHPNALSFSPPSPCSSSTYPSSSILLLDSTPGTLTFLLTLRAFSLSLPPYTPYVFISFVYLVFRLYLQLTNTPDPMSQNRADLHRISGLRGRGYVYSKQDLLVDWREVEKHAREEQKRHGGEVRLERFEGSGHVSHLREDEGRYRGVVEGLWLGDEKGGEMGAKVEQG